MRSILKNVRNKSDITSERGFGGFEKLVPKKSKYSYFLVDKLTNAKKNLVR